MNINELLQEVRGVLRAREIARLMDVACRRQACRSNKTEPEDARRAKRERRAARAAKRQACLRQR